MKLLPIPPSLAALLVRGRAAALMASAEAALPTTPAPLPTHAAPDWQSALLRRRAQDDDFDEADGLAEPTPLAPPLAALLPAAPPDAPVPVGGLAPTTPTTEKIDALRQLADAAPAAVPVARAWQVELPAAAAGAAWQLHIEQLQPAAPLNLELRVPPAAQSQARQQLADLDKRLRDAGHDVLRPRLGDSRQRRRHTPQDEVDL